MLLLHSHKMVEEDNEDIANDVSMAIIDNVLVFTKSIGKDNLHKIDGFSLEERIKLVNIIYNQLGENIFRTNSKLNYKNKDDLFNKNDGLLIEKYVKKYFEKTKEEVMKDINIESLTFRKMLKYASALKSVYLRNCNQK